MNQSCHTYEYITCMNTSCHTYGVWTCHSHIWMSHIWMSHIWIYHMYECIMLRIWRMNIHFLPCAWHMVYEYITCINALCHTYGVWICHSHKWMSHIWMSHSYTWQMYASDIFIRHMCDITHSYMWCIHIPYVIHMEESIWMSHSYTWQMSQIWMSHVWIYQMYECIMLRIWRMNMSRTWKKL